ncbi:MAG: hypothetical protein R3C28_29265 [Pirellulaceae bacterium]
MNPPLDSAYLSVLILTMLIWWITGRVAQRLALEPETDKVAEVEDENDEEDTESDDAQAEVTEVGDASESAVASTKDVPQQRITIGSLDPTSPYRMLVTFDNAGAAVERMVN